MVKIPAHEVKDGISLKKTKPNIPDDITGPSNIITDSTNGDSLFNDAKNKLSPIAIPQIPLIAMLNKSFELTLKLLPVKERITNNNVKEKTELIVVMPTGSSRSPSFFRMIEYKAQLAVDINAVIIPIIEVGILFEYFL